MAVVPTVLTAAVGAKNRAADYLTYIRDAVSFFLSPPRCQVYQNSLQTLATSGTTAVVTFDSELYDTDRRHSTSTNTSRMVATTAGLYQLLLNIGFATNGTGYRTINVRKNAAGAAGGGTNVATVRLPAAPTLPSLLPLCVEVQMAAADYLEVFATQSSGGALDLVIGVANTNASMRWVASS